MTTISAKTILRSRNGDKVLSTLLLRYPRFIHAELLTHRALSRNAASSRAIPFEKQVSAMLEDPAFPIHWGANQKGMRADSQIADWKIAGAEATWRLAMHAAVNRARELHDLGLHKALVNRIIEPFTHMVCLVSATEWDNFLELRDHPDAEPHIQVLAQEIRKCLDQTDDIRNLQPGEWHLPFADDRTLDLDDRIRLSVARCASTSYKTVDGFDMTLERAIEVHDKLVGSRPIHASPCEHVAMADGMDYYDRWQNSYQHRNFVGFRQYRAMLS